MGTIKMIPLNHINHGTALGKALGQAPAEKRGSVDTNDWFSLSGLASGSTIHATSTFSAGAGVREIASQILAHIGEPAA